MKFSSTKLSSLLFVAVSATIVGCAQMPGRSTEDVITQRSNAFWDARMKNNAAEAYKFTPPSYRQLKDVERFRTDYAGIPMVDKREVVSVICEEADGRCVLKQKFDVEPPMMRGQPLVDGAGQPHCSDFGRYTTTLSLGGDFHDDRW